jgi:DNA-binding MarR family transcriptional regulator
MSNGEFMEEELTDMVQNLASDIRAQSQRLELNTFNSLLFTADMVSKYLDIETAEYSIGRTGLNLLFTLVLHGGSMTPTAISKKIFRSKFAVTKMMDTLEKRGLVKRGLIGNDRRTREVFITEKGLGVVQTVSVRERTRLGPEILSILDQSELEAFNSILRKIRKHISDTTMEPQALAPIPDV